MNIKELFSRNNEGILSVYFTAGYPHRESTADILLSLQAAGTDMVEIGAPYSDPLADGTTIQESSRVALQNGISLQTVFEQVRSVRSRLSMPMMLMGYFNQFYQYGFEALLKNMSESGIEGLIIPDLPEDYYMAHYQSLFEDYGIKISFLITPETEESRVRLLDELSTAFLYIVAQSATTGASNTISPEQEAYFKRIMNMQLGSPGLIGFGIHDRKSFEDACRFSEGAIIGSAFIRMLKEEGLEGIDTFIRKIKGS